MELDHLAEIFRVLGDPTRLKIIALLQVRDLCASELVSVFPVSQPAVSRHMSRLKQLHIVKEQRQGMRVVYTMNREYFEELRTSLFELPDLSSELRTLRVNG